jgi:transcriptional regulator with XRE-family HTH domain
MTLSPFSSWYKIGTYSGIKSTGLKMMSISQTVSLGSFIRTRRERISPEQVGLPAGLRRRAKGLRREELAGLCGISPTWLTWIEQGRTDSVSANAISRIAGALLLSRAERDYLFELAGVHDPEKATLVSELNPGETLAEAVVKIQTPAYVLDRAWNAIAWNRHASRLFVGWLEKESSGPNLLKYVFLNPQARDFIAEWPLRAHRIVAEFRGDCKAIMDDPEISTQIAELRRQSPEFDSFWSAHNVLEREGGERTFLHPILGKITLRQLTLRLANSPNLKLVLLL